MEQNVDIPVPHCRGGRGGPQDFLPGLDSTAFCGADRVVPGAADEAFTWCFSHFSPKFKKVRRLGPHSGSELPAESSPSTRASLCRAHGARGGRVGTRDGEILVDEDGSIPWEVVLARYGLRWGDLVGRARLGFLEGDMGCGCFFLVAWRRAWCWRVRLSGVFSSSEASRAAAGFQGFCCPSLANDRCYGGTD